MLAGLSVLRFCSVIGRDQCRLSAAEQPNGKELGASRLKST
jgi:hypothetical protein